MSSQTLKKRPYDSHIRSENSTWNAPKTQNHARQEVDHCLFEAKHTAVFLNTFLPIKEKHLVDDIYNVLVKGRNYNEASKSWPDLGKRTDPETDFYTGFAKLARIVTDHVDIALGKTPSVVWVDTHLRSLFTGHAHAGKFKPDVSAIRLPALYTPPSGKPYAWCDVMIPFEVKRDPWPTARFDALLQLLTYVRSVLRDQPNRRFSFGLQIAEDLLDVWLFDRSGGLRCSFDIRKVCTTAGLCSPFLTNVQRRIHDG